ncbi:hypothetical protein BH11PSE8_BH11PSE8_45800 [soil metagenome]
MTPTAPVGNLKRLAAVLAAMLITFAGLFGWQAWRSEKQDQIDQMRTALDLGQNAIDPYFSQVEASLLWLSMDLLGPDGRLQDAQQTSARLARFRQVHPQMSAINLVGMNGQMLASSVPEALVRLPDLSKEPSFRSFLAEPTPHTRLAIGRPLFGRVSERWVTPMRLVVHDAEGRAVAILAASFPVELLQSFWTHAPITAKASMGLLRDDGFLISRFPLPANAAMQDVYGQPRAGALYKYLQQQRFPASGYVEGANQLSAVEAGNVFARLGHFPVTMFVSVPTAEFRKAWWRRVRVPFALLVLLSFGGWAGYRYTLTRQNAWDSERRQTEKDLRTSEGEQRFLIDHIMAGVIVHDASGAVVSANAEACRLFGLTVGQMLGREPVDPQFHFIREDGSRLPLSEYGVKRVQATGQPIADLVVGLVASPTARPVWVIANLYPEFGPDKALRQIIVTFVDITARRVVEQALQQSENRYRMLFENSMDAVLQTVPAGPILAANEAACKMFGMTEEELIREGRERVIDTTDRRLVPFLAQREANGRAIGELTMRRGDGSRFEAELSSALYADESGALLASLVVRDMTERRRSESATLAKDLAEQANRAKSEFIARMSHELRTPLNAIIGFSEVLQLDDRHPLAPSQRQQLTHVQRAGDHLLLLINDLLDLSRIEAGQLSMQLEDVDTLEVVHDAVREVATQASALRVRVRVEAPAYRIAPARVDPTRLRQIILNLLSNAIKYNRPDGEVALSLMADAERVKLVFRDTGMGLSPEQVGTLFQPFNRLGRETSAIEGTGIGLVITRSLVEAMGGTLTVESRVGQGSEFTVTLPLATAVAGGDPAASPIAAGARAALQGRVIYIDDDEVNLLLMQAFLVKRPGITLLTVSDGRSGMALALAAPPDLMMIDLMMPDMDGFDVLEAVRAAPALRHVPCVAVSANAMPNEIDAAIAEGFDGYVTKPIASHALLAEIDRWM